MIDPCNFDGYKKYERVKTGKKSNVIECDTIKGYKNKTVSHLETYQI